MVGIEYIILEILHILACILLSTIIIIAFIILVICILLYNYNRMPKVIDLRINMK
jgi:hypothetical protein